MSTADIGLIGLAVMGSNLALNIAEKGNRIAVFNRSPEATRKFFAEAGDLQGQIVPCETLEEFVAAMRGCGPPPVTASAAAEALRIAEEIVLDIEHKETAG